VFFCCSKKKKHKQSLLIKNQINLSTLLDLETVAD